MTESADKQNETEDFASQKAEPRPQTSGEDEEKKADATVIEELKTELKAKDREAKENYDRFLRSSAELENYKKRSARQMEEFRKFANEALLLEILGVVDNLERAVASSAIDGDSNAGVIEGVHLTLAEIERILDKFGAKPIDALEQTFDPAYHQAVMQEEADDFPAQTVIRELQKGYLLHDRLLRPAMVVVSKLPSTLAEEK